MIIKNTASGPSYSTDSTAQSFRTFVRPSAYAPTERRTSHAPVGRVDFTELYPSIFAQEAPRPSLVATFARSCVRLAAHVKAGIVSVRGHVVHH
jgi:hypothetical protein